MWVTKKFYQNYWLSLKGEYLELTFLCSKQRIHIFLKVETIFDWCSRKEEYLYEEEQLEYTCRKGLNDVTIAMEIK